MHIPTSEIIFPSFHTDMIGFTFVWRGHFLRGIFPKAVSRVKQLFDSGFINEICSLKLFPKTWVSEYENESFGMIIEHELLSPIIFATEWNAAMLKDAALVVLKIAGISNKYGFNMYDCHKLNILFHNNIPYYVDLGSFIPKDYGSTGWKPYLSYLQSYYYILNIWTHGSPNIAKSLMYPEKELESYDYYCYKNPIFRYFPSILNLLIRKRRKLYKLAYLGFEEIGQLMDKASNSKEKAILYQKKIINSIKPLSSQDINICCAKVSRQKITEIPPSDKSKIDDHIESIILLCDTMINSVTIIGASSIQLLTKLSELESIKSIISICKDDTYSSGEYYYCRHNDVIINSVSFDVVKRMVAFNNSPEMRLSSDLVVVHQLDTYKEIFGIANAIVYLSICGNYSKTGIMIIHFIIDKEFLSMIQQKYEIMFSLIDGNNHILMIKPI